MTHDYYSFLFYLFSPLQIRISRRIFFSVFWKGIFSDMKKESFCYE